MPSESRARIYAPLDKIPGRRVRYLDGGNSVGSLAKKSAAMTSSPKFPLHSFPPMSDTSSLRPLHRVDQEIIVPRSKRLHEYRQ